MGIKPSYSKKEFENQLKRSKDNFIQDIANCFFELGKRAVDVAVSDGNYVNRTGVLRSSIGCAVVINGLIVKEYGFKNIGPNALQGQRLGKKLLESLSRTNIRSNQIKLIIVAGADYASFVEDTSNFVVLSQGISFVESNLPSVLRQLKVIL